MTAAAAMRTLAPIAPGETLTLLDEAGPGLISHVWFTIASDDPNHLKALVLRMYWDGESTPSVETPVGDFFGLGLGDYHLYQSAAVVGWLGQGSEQFFPDAVSETCAHHGHERGLAQRRTRSISTSTIARTASRCRRICFISTRSIGRPRRRMAGRMSGSSNGDPLVDGKKNLNGDGNYVWMEATGRGHFVGVTMSVLQNQDGWWGEGDDMFFVDGETHALDQRNRVGRLFSGSVGLRRTSVFVRIIWRAGGRSRNVAGGRWSLYRFHLDSPIPFTKSLRATIEHGHANHRSDNYFSVAYWYQTEPHAAFPALPPLEQRIPRIYAVGGPGNAGK